MEYYRCEWLVLPLFHPLSEGLMLDQLISQCDGKLILQPYTFWTVRSDGCHILPFVWSVPSEKALLDCLDNLKDYLQFSNFTPATEEDAIGISHPFAPMGGRMDFLVNLRKMADHNQHILSQS